MRIRRHTRRRSLAALSLAAAALVVAPAASADLYRCTRPDGRIVFTDNTQACPQARKHEPTGVVQHIQNAPPRATRPAALGGSASLSQQAEASAEASWRAKKAASEAELEHLEGQHESLRSSVTWCNRGGELYQKDDVGIKRSVSCHNVQAEFRALGPRIAKLRRYLAEGLEDECRRAGCLPGWLR